MPTEDYHGWWISYPHELAHRIDLISGTPSEQIYWADYYMTVVHDYAAHYPVTNIERAAILLDHIIRALDNVHGVSQWGLVLPDAYTIGEDLSIEGPDWTPLLDALAALETRVTALEGVETPPYPTLDSLTSEAHERKVEIAESWIQLMGDIMTLEAPDNVVPG